MQELATGKFHGVPPSATPKVSQIPAFRKQWRFPFMALIGHRDGVEECPLLGVKRTSKFESVTSAFDPKRTLGTVILRTPERVCVGLTTVVLVVTISARLRFNFVTVRIPAFDLDQIHGCREGTI
jgi:hypothetical protein